MGNLVFLSLSLSLSLQKLFPPEEFTILIGALLYFFSFSSLDKTATRMGQIGQYFYTFYKFYIQEWLGRGIKITSLFQEEGNYIISKLYRFNEVIYKG